MIAYVISTGDEVLLGDIVDTNSARICKTLRESGIQVVKIAAVPDDMDLICDIINEAAECCDVCIVTGGLGPTQDDITALACSRVAGEELSLNPQAYESMTAFFESKGAQVTEENKKQALLPESALVLENKAGTAPGFYIRIKECLFFFLPGVPDEMRIMLDTEVLPVLENKFSLNRIIAVERLTVFGLPESLVGKQLESFESLFPEFRLGFRADFPVIEVKIVQPQTRILPSGRIKEARQWVMDQLKYKISSKKGRSIAQEVGHLLVQKKMTLAVAESCTGGLISNMITDVAGSSDYFLFSGITYANSAKINILGVDAKVIEKRGAVDEETARQMALGAKKISRADIAVSTTGIAGPSGGTDTKPVGRVCIGVADATGCTGHTYTFNFGDRTKNKQIFATMALELVRRRLDPID